MAGGHCARLALNVAATLNQCAYLFDLPGLCSTWNHYALRIRHRLQPDRTAVCAYDCPVPTFDRKRCKQVTQMKYGLFGLLLLNMSFTGAASAVIAASDDIPFATVLSPDEEVSPTETRGQGQVELWLERGSLKIRWRVTFSDLTSAPTQLGLFGPENAGATAGLLVSLGGAGMKSPFEGSATLTDGQFQYLITTRVYANLMTKKYPGGELRGQLRRLRSPAPAPMP